MEPISREQTKLTEAGEAAKEVPNGQVKVYWLAVIGYREGPAIINQLYHSMPAVIQMATSRNLPESYYESRGSDLLYLFIDRELVEIGYAEWVPGDGVKLTHEGEEFLESLLEIRDHNPLYLPHLPELIETLAS